jgi:DNA-binding IclR family transcriptional regulator
MNSKVQILNTDRVPGQQSVRRAVDVLFCFDADHPSLSAAEVGAMLGMNRTTAWRYLQTLTRTGLVRDVGDSRFGLGARTLSLAGAYTSQWSELEAVAGTALLRLRDEVGETAALHLRQGWSRIVVRQLESHHELHRTYRDVGVPISLLTGAPSLAILAALPDAEGSLYLDAHVGAMATAPVDREQVERELERIRATGYAVSHGSRVPNVASVAAAVHDPHGAVLAAVNVTGPADRLRERDVERVARAVTAAARWIEQQLVARSQGPVVP